MIDYRDILLRLIADELGIIARNEMALRKFDALEDRVYAAKREMEQADDSVALAVIAVQPDEIKLPDYTLPAPQGHGPWSGIHLSCAGKCIDLVTGVEKKPWES